MTPRPIVFSPHTGQTTHDITRYPVLSYPCNDPTDYDKGLRSIWLSKGDIVIVEHDIVAFDDDVTDLIECPWGLCARAYLLHSVSTGLRFDVVAHRLDGEWITEGMEWADHVGLGLTKFHRNMRLVDLWEPGGEWFDLDTRVSERYHEEGLKFHIHWPTIEHKHREDDVSTNGRRPGG